MQLSPAKNSWVALPSPLAMQLLQSNTPMPAIFQLTPQGAPGAPPTAPNAHVAWVGDICTAPGAIIQVPTALAACLQLLPGVQVTLQVRMPPSHTQHLGGDRCCDNETLDGLTAARSQHVPHVPLATTVVVEPASVDDWEMVECNAQLLEEQLLTQVGVVRVGQRTPFWVTPQSPLFLSVASCQPAPTVRLAPGVEVAVAPRPRAMAADVVAAEPAPREEGVGSVKRPVWLRLLVR